MSFVFSFTYIQVTNYNVYLKYSGDWNCVEMEKMMKMMATMYLVICDTKIHLKGWEVCVDVNLFVYDHTRDNYAPF